MEPNETRGEPSKGVRSSETRHAPRENQIDAKETYRLDGPNGSILHAEIQIGDSRVMLGEASDQCQPMPATMALYVEDADAWYERALKAGATSVREPADQFYGDRSAGVKDFAGNQWWIHTHVEDVPHEEIKKRAEVWMKEQRCS